MEKSNSWTWIFVIIALFVLYQTNPSLADHRAEAKKEISSSLSKNLAASTSNFWVKEFGAMLGIAAVEESLDQSITRNNYYFFSTTHFSMYGINETIGLGILGKVFISNSVNKEVDKLFNKGKDLLNTDNKSNEQGSNHTNLPADTNVTIENSNDENNDKSTSDNNIAVGQQYEVLASPSFPVTIYNTPDDVDKSNQEFKSSLTVTVKKIRNGYAYVIYNDAESSEDFIEGWIRVDELSN